MIVKKVEEQYWVLKKIYNGKDTNGKDILIFDIYDGKEENGEIVLGSILAQNRYIREDDIQNLEISKFNTVLLIV